MCLCARWVGAVGGRAPGARCQQETREAGTWRRNRVRPAVLRARGAQRQETNCSRFVLSFVCLPTPLPSPSGCPHRDHSGSSNSERFTTKCLPGYKRIPTHGHQQAEPELPTAATSRMVSGLVLAASRVVPGSVASPFPQPQLVRKNKLSDSTLGPFLNGDTHLPKTPGANHQSLRRPPLATPQFSEQPAGSWGSDLWRTSWVPRALHIGSHLSLISFLGWIGLSPSCYRGANCNPERLSTQLENAQHVSDKGGI